MVLSQETLEGIVGFSILDFDQYITVFTHKSAIREMGRESYERMEFMGDAVINFVVAKYLFDMFPNADEGVLTRIRTKLVSGKCLCDMARKLGLEDHIIMNRKAMQAGWNRNPRILEDVFESLVGCIYLQMGMSTAKDFLLGVFNKHVDFTELLLDTNYKDGLMRYTQSKGLSLPEYQVMNDPQITKQPLFDVVVEVAGYYGRGRDMSKKSAEQEAAKNVLCCFGVISSSGHITEFPGLGTNLKSRS